MPFVVSNITIPVIGPISNIIGKENFMVATQEADMWERLLIQEEIDFTAENLMPNTTIATYEIPFDSGYAAHVSVCSGETDIRVEPVLYKDGCEVKRLEPDIGFLGLYTFIVDEGILMAFLDTSFT